MTRSLGRRPRLGNDARPTDLPEGRARRWVRWSLATCVLFVACSAPDPDLVRRLDERIEHLEERARIQEASYERQIGDLQERLDEVSAENASLEESLESLRTVSGSDASIERQIRLLDQQLDACHQTLDQHRTDLDRCLAGGR